MNTTTTQHPIQDLITYFLNFQNLLDCACIYLEARHFSPLTRQLWPPIISPFLSAHTFHPVLHPVKKQGCIKFKNGNPNPIRIRNLNCGFGLLIFTTFKLILG